MTTFNRVLWLISGVVLAILGVLGVVTSLNGLFQITRGTAVAPMWWNSVWHRWGFWAPVLVIAVGVLFVVLGLLLLRSKTRRGHPHPIHELTAASRGTTRIPADVLSQALAADLTGRPGIATVSAVLFDSDLVLDVAISPDLGIDRLAAEVDLALDRFATTSGLRPRLRDVDVRIVDAAVSRVR